MEYKRAMDKLVAAESELIASYPQIKELFDRYQSAQIELISINNRQEFVNGFKMGARIEQRMACGVGACLVCMQDCKGRA